MAAVIAIVQYTTGYQYLNQMLRGNDTAVPASGASPVPPIADAGPPSAQDQRDDVDPSQVVDEWTSADTSNGYRLFAHPAGFSLKIPLQFDRRTKLGSATQEWEFQTADATGTISVVFTEDASAEQPESVKNVFEVRRASYGVARPEYARLTDRWYVLSDYQGDTEFYECAARFRYGAVWGWARFVVKYPKTASARFDGEMQTLFESFRDSSASNIPEG